MKKLIATIALLALAAPAFANGEKTPDDAAVTKTSEPAEESASSVSYEEADEANELRPGELVGRYIAPASQEGDAR